MTLDNSWASKTRKDSFQSMCKSCTGEYRKEWLLRNKDKELSRRKAYYAKNKDRISELNERQRVKRKYGVTLEYVASHREKICGLCEICRKNTATDIDHCHGTGIFRGLLCSACNTGLGRFSDSAESLRNAIEYLERFKEKVEGLSV
jgi:hypothetical protein